MYKDKISMSSDYIMADDEVEIELLIRTPMFEILKEAYTDSEKKYTPINEINYKYYNENNATLRQVDKEYELKSLIARKDVGPIRIRMSIEEPIEYEKIKNSKQCAKILHNSDGTMRRKKRWIVYKEGYEIHFTTVNDRDSYIEFELSKRVKPDFDDLIQNVEYCLYKYNIEVPKLWDILGMNGYVKTMKPIEISRRTIRQYDFLMKPFYATKKLDGERRFLVRVQNWLVQVTTSGQHTVLVEYEKSVDKPYVYDTEFFKEKYYVFDILMHDGINLTKSHKIMDRLELLKDVTLPRNAILKEGEMVYNQEDLYNFIKKFKDDKDIDGIIIYDLEKNYMDKESVFKYKYKPTIDVFTNYKCVYVQDGGDLVEVDIKIDCKENTLTEPAVVECTYSDGVLKLLRSRPDKDLPNGLEVYQSFIEMYTQNQLLELSSIEPKGKDLFLMQVVHNRCKSDIIKTLGGHVLDIGSGRGGDLFKWNSNKKIKSVTCVEPNEDNVSEFNKRLEQLARNKIDIHNINFLNFKCEDNYFDVITAFFMINCVSYDDIDKFIQNAYNMLKHGSYIYVIFMNGAKEVNNDFVKFNGNKVTVTFPGTMVNNHVEYKYTFSGLVKRFQNAGFKLKKGNDYVITNDWLRDYNKEVCEMYKVIKLLKV